MSQCNVLLVEDDDVDVVGIKRAWRRHKIAHKLHRACNGEEALAMLRGLQGYEPISRPLMILLDLNMPTMNGFEFLDALRADPDLRHHIVFVLTTSDDSRDRKRAYESAIAGYLVKQHLSSDYHELLDLLEDYWSTVEFP